MKAISLWEPWATLMALGLKHVETRSWSTNYRGPLLICAAKRKMDADGIFVLDRVHEYHRTCRIPEVNFFPHYGQAVCIVDLTRCDEIVPFEPNALEHFLGDYTPGRFAWTTDNLRKITPFAVRGSQGFFEVEVVAP